MPIYDLGYRGWQGRTVPEAGRFWAIAETGMRLAWQTKFLRRLLVLAWVPTLYVAIGFFLYEQLESARPLAQQSAERLSQQFSEASSAPSAEAPSEQSAERRAQEAAQRRARQAAQRRSGQSQQAVEFLGRLIPVDPEQLTRHGIWSWLLSIFLRYPQGVVMVLVVGMIAPPLVAQDVRSRAFVLYFSRPITRIEYILGKMAVLWVYLALITALPALFLYLLGVFLSPQLSVIVQTWDLPLRILAASAVLMIPTTALALALSSLTSESRYATFAWFGIWVLGWVTYAMLNANLPGSRTAERGTLASLYHTLGRVQHWVFGLEKDFANVSSSAIELAAITVVSLVILFRRVSSPMRA